jgi:hypothetical protein
MRAAGASLLICFRYVKVVITVLFDYQQPLKHLCGIQLAVLSPFHELNDECAHAGTRGAKREPEGGGGFAFPVAGVEVYPAFFFCLIHSCLASSDVNAVYSIAIILSNDF